MSHHWIESFFAFFIAVIFLVVGSVEAAVDVSEIEDEDITRAIETELLFNDAVSSHLIDVETREGIVTLSGSVDNLLAKEQALAIAEATRGVRSVIDQLQIFPVTRSDRDIRDDVNRALMGDPATDSYEIEVQVSDGVVILRGTVDSWQEKSLSEQVAKGVRGVKDIQNNIVIHSKAERMHGEIKAEVER